MKDALAEQASDSLRDASTDDNGGAGKSTLFAELKEAQKRCVLLEAKLLQLEALQQPPPSSQSSGGGDTKLINALSEVSAQLALCKAELLEATRTIDAKNARIAELEASVAQISQERPSETMGGVSSDRVVADAQVSDLKRRLASAEVDIQRLVNERSQLMELSNQLRADLRKLREQSGGHDDMGPSSKAFAGKKEYENLVAELSRSLEEARLHNKTLKKELRRMVKFQVLHSGDAEEDGERAAPRSSRRTMSMASSAATETTLDGGTRRRSSTLSMMKALAPPPSTTSADGVGTRSKRSSLAESVDSSRPGDFDAELLSLVRNKLPSGGEGRSASVRSSPSSTSSTPDTHGRHHRTKSVASSRPKRIPEQDDEDELGEDEESDDSRPESRRRPSSGDGEEADKTPPKSTLSSLFQRDRLDSTASNEGANTTTKVSDARLRLQQDILFLPTRLRLCMVAKSGS